MDDLDKHIKERKKRDPKFAKGFEEGYLDFKIGELIKQARKEAGVTQKQLAEKLNTKTEAISRLENHAQDVKISTLSKIAQALGKNFNLSFS